MVTKVLEKFAGSIFRVGMMRARMDVMANKTRRLAIQSQGSWEGVFLPYQ
jgi:hypothetical protein